MKNESIQIHRWADGSFVVHKINMPGKKYHASAWFGPGGHIRDAEYATPHGLQIRSASVLAALEQRFRYLRTTSYVQG